MIRGYLIRLTAASILASLIRRAAPEGGPGRAARLGAGLLVLLVAFGPLGEADPLEAARNLVRQGYGDVLTAEDFGRDTNQLLADLISQQAEAYILDKAEGISLTVEVETKVEDTYPVPWSVTIRGSPTALERIELSRVIAEDLGIPKERQEWWSM